GSEVFQKFVRRYLAPCIKVIGYRFEGRWLQQCQKKIRRLPDLPTLSRKEKTELLKLDPNTEFVWPEAVKSNEDVYEPELSNAFSIWEFEQRIKSACKGGMATFSEGEETIPAKYVSFVGDSFAYLTESHKVPVVTGLITSNKTAQQQIPLHKVDEINVGDYVVLKEGGSKDVIQAMADLMLGEKASKLRQLAGTWKRTLHECFFTPETLHAKIREAGGTLNLATAANWLNDDFRIGPGQKTDLELIARIIGFTEFDGKLDEIWHAIKTIRSAHLSAGMRLKKVLLHKLPEHLEAIREEGTRINIDNLVTAWVVQVESIGSEFEPYSKLKVNELQWDKSAGLANWLS
ncbi:MAG: DrmE family protein, partial [candidate division KSB1 bacterium]|nr:DrmE family protein [candidate division KSB1 bacterium]